jgi:hypothetical protein
VIVTCPCCSVTRLRVECPEDSEGYRCERSRQQVPAPSAAEREVLPEPANPPEVVTVTDTPVSCPEPRPSGAHEIRADAGKAPSATPPRNEFRAALCLWRADPSARGSGEAGAVLFVGLPVEVAPRAKGAPPFA